jgi:hypothetical protein
LQPKDKQLGAHETLIKLANNRFNETKASKCHKKAKKNLLLTELLTKTIQTKN